MLSRGVKFRIAPKHTCGKFPVDVNRIKIPKCDPKKTYHLIIQRGGIEESNKAYKVLCQKQVIEGVTIPQGYEVWIPSSGSTISHEYSSRPMIFIPDWKLNDILRKLYLDELRNGK